MQTETNLRAVDRQAGQSNLHRQHIAATISLHFNKCIRMDQVRLNERGFIIRQI